MPDSRRIPLLLGLLFGLAGMGTSSATIVLPALAHDLDVSVGVAAWSISLYVLMLAVTTALYGRVSDLVGIRTPLLVGLGLMAGGALVAAAAPTFPVLLAARMFQGAGAAAIPTLGVAILSQRYDGAVRGAALGTLAGIAVAFGLGQPSLMAGVGDATASDVRGVALGIATLLFLVGGSVGSAEVAGLGDVIGIPASLAVLAALPLVGILVLRPLVRSDRRQRVEAAAIL